MPAQEQDQLRREELMKATVKVVAEKGLENTATNMICSESGVNVAYIYRLFENKEDLLARTFADEDEKFLNWIFRHLPVLRYDSMEFELRCRTLFMKCWDFLLERPQELLFYVRYYSSSSFLKYAYTEHEKRCTLLVDAMKTAFPDSVDVRTVLHHILDTLLSAASKQVSNPIDGDAEAAGKCFQLIFSVVKNCVKQEPSK